MLGVATEAMAEVVSYLRATDMCACLEASKAVFPKTVVSRAIKLVMLKYGDDKDVARCQDQLLPPTLFCMEIRSILTAINTPPPANSVGFWISAAWLSNTKLYYEALPLPDTGSVALKKGTPNKKQSKIRARRGSDALPPWPAINSEITCGHLDLAPSKGARAKRRLVSKKQWLTLRRFFPLGPEFKSHVTECSECAAPKEDKAPAESSKIKSRYLDVYGDLYSVYVRKSGVPSHCLTVKDEWQAAFGVHLLRPLVPGLYHIVPREWLKRWRQYIKDASISAPPLFDCSSVLCEEHGFLLVPPHIEEYLVGLRRTLLSGLGDYAGEQVEVLTTDEYAALQTQNIKGIEDFQVCFSCDAEGAVQWSVDRCSICHPVDKRLELSAVQFLL